MSIENAIYTDPEHSTINVDFDGKSMSVPVNLDNRHYAEIVEQGIVIADYVAPPVDDPADIAEQEMINNPFTRALIKRMAREAGKTPRQIMDEIRSDV